MKETQDAFIPASILLRPRRNLPWKGDGVFKVCWSRPFLIENRITRAAMSRCLYEEQVGRDILRGQVGGELALLPAYRTRFWKTEYAFLEKMMSLAQLTIYAPAFIRLAKVMPQRLVYSRQQVVRRYLEGKYGAPGRYISGLCRRFIRSSVLLYPAERLISSADSFLDLARRSADQSAAANRERVIMLLRSLHMMTDQEICDQFQQEQDYLDELKLLADLARHYRIGAEEVFRVSAEEMAWFWERYERPQTTRG
ncbi:MAG: hypothetical protein EP348_04490 [Alphaproteobacteria bacterium]|nr:MAG: hypothetical protein EP348_04490 [Alphaproteobacteria bacterium]